jgi:hypothetical protein
MKILLAIIGLLILSRVLKPNASVLSSAAGTPLDSTSRDNLLQHLKEPQFPFRGAARGIASRFGIIQPVIHGRDLAGAVGSPGEYGFRAGGFMPTATMRWDLR